MKKIFSLGMLFCFLTSSALAATSDEALKLLILGNQKYVLENSLQADLAATIIVDPAMEISPASLFNLPDSRLKVTKADSVVLDGRFTPVIIVLGPNEESVWEAYGKVVEQSPNLVQAVLKGETSVLGATVSDEDGAVSILGAHPDLMVMAGQYILGAPAQKSTPEETAPVEKAESTPEPVSKKAEPAPAKIAKVEETPDTDAKIEQASTPVEEVHEAPVSPQASASGVDEAQAAPSGGSGLLSVILVVAAIIGVVILMDKTILKA